MSSFVRVPAERARRTAEHAAQHLATDQRVQLVYLFGSAADPQRATVRDVDVAVLARPPIPFDELLQLRADLMKGSDVEIDLVTLDDAPVVLAHEVVDAGRCLFARDPDVETNFVTQARARYWDFKPYLDEQWRLAGERLKEQGRGALHE